MINKNQNLKGFTLVETLVSLFIFGMMSVAVTNIFVGSINTQTRILQNQDMMNQSNYALEYMGKAIRMAKKDASGLCAPLGGSYGLDEVDGKESITFLVYDTTDKADRCRKFSLGSNNVIQESRSTTNSKENFLAPQDITSSSVKVNDLSFYLSGYGIETPDEAFQPKITIMIKMAYNTPSNPPVLIMQTSISQRELDI